MKDANKKKDFKYIEDKQYKVFQELEDCIIDRYHSYKEVGGFWVEYSLREDKVGIWICKMGVDNLNYASLNKHNYLKHIESILVNGVYYIFKSEGAVRKGKIYELMNGLIDLKNYYSMSDNNL